MSAYTNLDKSLHRLFLGNSQLSEFLYDRLLKKGQSKEIDSCNHIFVTGLARSGTTAILNKLYASQKIGSFLYKHMPFILSPTLAKVYSNLNSSQKVKGVERLHKDSIYINSHSPECLDEVFWIKSFPHLKKIHPVEYQNISNAVLSGYSYLLSSFAKIQNQSRMLIKNNNHHIRLKVLSKYFPNSHFLCLIRDPIAHSRSLLSQHLNFLEIHQKDPFALEYMNLIGHYEFGQNCIPFSYSSDNQKWYSGLNKLTLEYWLLQWINTYKWIFNSDIANYKNVHIIVYERICESTHLFTQICELTGLPTSYFGLPLKSSNSNWTLEDLNVKRSILDEAMDTYNSLLKQSFNP